MKKLSASLLALATALVVAPAAHADTTPGWYAGAGLDGSFAVVPTIHYKTGSHDAKDEGVGLGEAASGGYAFGYGLRLEGEFFHDQNNTDGVKGYTGAGGHVSNNALFANALYDFNMGSRYTPYIGAGIGPDFIHVKSVGATGVGYLKGDTLDAAYQGIAGVSAQLDPNWAVTADYRYIASFDPKVDSTTGGQGRVDNASHNVMLGLRYSFGSVPAMHTASAPMVAPQMATKTATAAQAQDFMVFFDFNKATLTPEAKRIIASAAKQFKAGHFVKIAITGHTDTVGTTAYNEKLSKQRAAAVEAELKSLGVATKSITETGVGKDGLMVPTADGVREAQNRRAEIVLSK